MEEKLINLTPHDVTIITDDGQRIVIAASGETCRVACTVRDTGRKVAGVRVTANTYGAVEGLPAPVPGTIYIVSAIVRAALIEQGIHRDDVMVPNETVRDDAGRIIGCRSLAI